MHPDGWKGKKVLITGGAGFLGSHLAEGLLLRGADVSILDQVKDPWRLRHVLNKIQYIQEDLVNWDGNFGDSTKPFEFIFHLAALSQPSVAQKEPELAFRQNVMAMVNLLQQARQFPVKKILFTSAGALYTNVPKYCPLDEKHPIDPLQGVYAMTKRIGELLLEDFFRNANVPFLYFRLFNTYGPQQSEEYLIPSFIKQAFTHKKITVLNETVRRDFNYVGDVVNAFMKGAESDFCGGPINIGTGMEHSVGEIARMIGALLGVEVECHCQETFGSIRQLCDNSQAKKVLRWKPMTSLDDGLRITVESYRSRWVMRDSPKGMFQKV